MFTLRSASRAVQQLIEFRSSFVGGLLGKKAMLEGGRGAERRQASQTRRCVGVKLSSRRAVSALVGPVAPSKVSRGHRRHRRHRLEGKL